MDMTVEAFCQTFSTLTRQSDRSHIAALLEALESLQVPAGKTLIHENTPSGALYLVLEGALSVSLNIGDKVLEFGKIAAGGCVGEISILDDAAEPATVTAASECTLLVLTEHKFKQLDKQSPAASTSLMRMLTHVMADRIRLATDLILPLLDATDTPANADSLLNNAYASLYGLGAKQ